MNGIVIGHGEVTSFRNAVLVLSATAFFCTISLSFNCNFLVITY